MKKQNNNILTLCKAGLLTFIFSGLWSASLLAQTVKQTYVDSDATHYYDIKITSGFEYLYVEAKGADGGKKDNKDDKHNGGIGARVSGYLKIGDGAGEVQAGSTLRLIPGQAGENHQWFASGGGGTGVAFKGPQANYPWQLLLVAGGGGGAGSTGSGKAGTTHSYGLAGDYGGFLNNNGGKDGNGGTHKGSEAYPGGGAFSDGGGGCPGHAGMQNNVPTGGLGGSTGCGELAIVPGGFGFGGGGSAIQNSSHYGYGGGGGGGGYSGGGGGTTTDGGGYAGGGGGSYANTDWILAQSLQSFGTTFDPEDGYVLYRYTNTSPFKTIHLAKDQTKCVDLTNGNTAKGTNIQLVQCKGNPAQQWLMDGTTIRLGENLNKCLDVNNSGTANGTNIQLFDCNGTGAQTWIYDAINQTFRSGIDPNKCLDLVNGNTTGGTNIQLYDCVYSNKQPNQQWVVDGIEVTPVTGTNLRIHLLENPDKALDIFAGRTDNETNIQLWRTQEVNNSQYFIFEGGQIKMQAHPDKCVDLTLSKTDNGKNIRLWDCNGTNAQNWIYDGFTRAFRSAIDLGKCLDVKGSDFNDGTNIQLWECNGTGAQQFEIY